MIIIKKMPIPIWIVLPLASTLLLMMIQMMMIIRHAESFSIPKTTFHAKGHNSGGAFVNNMVATSDFSRSTNNTDHSSCTSSIATPSLSEEQTICRQPQSQQQLNSIERYCLEKIDGWYGESQKVKCPFFRRRYGDVLDNLEWFVRNIIVRPPCRSSLGPIQACQPIQMEVGGRKGRYKSVPKTKNLPVERIMETIRRDWEGITRRRTNNNNQSSKGYYVTGKLSTSIYRDDCWFLSPDPDLPVQGLRKYIGIASHLFDSKTSHSELLSLQQQQQQEEENDTTQPHLQIKAEWKLSLTLKLPWRPSLPPFTGTTLYKFDEDNLIYQHEETWDISLLDAFLAMFPSKQYST
jgi:hypothetical protein